MADGGPGWGRRLLGGPDSWRRVALAGIGGGVALAVVAALIAAGLGGDGGSVEKSEPTAVVPIEGSDGAPTQPPIEEPPLDTPTAPVEEPTEAPPAQPPPTEEPEEPTEVPPPTDTPPIEEPTPVPTVAAGAG